MEDTAALAAEPPALSMPPSETPTTAPLDQAELVEELAPAPAVEETAAEPAVEEAAAEPAVEEPPQASVEEAAEPAVEEVATEPAVEEVAAEPAVEEAAEPAVEEVATEPAVEEVAAEPAVEEPTAESVAEEPPQASVEEAAEPAVEGAPSSPAVEAVDPAAVENPEPEVVAEPAVEAAVEETVEPLDTEVALEPTVEEDAELVEAATAAVPPQAAETLDALEAEVESSPEPATGFPPEPMTAAEAQAPEETAAGEEPVPPAPEAPPEEIVVAEAVSEVEDFEELFGALRQPAPVEAAPEPVREEPAPGMEVVAAAVPAQTEQEESLLALVDAMGVREEEVAEEQPVPAGPPPPLKLPPDHCETLLIPDEVLEQFADPYGLGLQREVGAAVAPPPAVSEPGGEVEAPAPALAGFQVASGGDQSRIQPVAPAPTIMAPASGPRMTLPGPALPPELASFQDGSIVTVLGEEARPKHWLPGWLLSLMVALVVLIAGLTVLFYLLPAGGAEHRAVEAPNAPAAARESVPAGEPVRDVVHPLSKYIEVTGFRFVVDFNKKSEIQYIVVNHSAAEVGDITVHVTLRVRGKPQQSPVCAYSFQVPTLAPFESREMRSSIEKLSRAYDLPDWQNLQADVQVTAP